MVDSSPWMIGNLVFTIVIIVIFVSIASLLFMNGSLMEDQFGTLNNKLEKAVYPGEKIDVLESGGVSYRVKKAEGTKSNSQGDPSGLILQVYASNSCLDILHQLNKSGKFKEFPKNLNELYNYQGNFLICMATATYSGEGNIPKGIETYSSESLENLKKDGGNLCTDLNSRYYIWDNSMICKRVPGLEKEGLYLNVRKEGPLKWISSGPNDQLGFASLALERSSYDVQRINLSYTLD